MVNHILTQDTRTAKNEYLTFQVNRSITVKSGSKPTTQTLKRYNTVEHWTTIEGTLETLANYLGESNTVRAGIKKGGNAKSDVTTASVIFVDFDNAGDDFVSIADHSNNPHVGIIYRTPSYTVDNQKHRIVYALSRAVTASEYELIFKRYILDIHPECDRSCWDAGRLFYGAVSRDAVQYNPDAIPLPVDYLLDQFESCMEVGSTTNDYDYQESRTMEGALTTSNEALSNALDEYWNESDTITAKVLAYLRGGYNTEDISSLYGVYEHQFKERIPTETERSAGIIAKYEGYNPFSLSNGSGTSFVVSDMGELLPTWYDRSNTVKISTGNGKTRSGGTFIDYWYLLHVNRYESIEKDFKRIVNDICDYLELHHFYSRNGKINPHLQKIIDAKQGKVNGAIIDEIIDQFQVYVCKFQKRESYYFYRDASSLYWDYCTERTIRTHYIYPMLKRLDLADLAVNDKFVNALIKRLMTDAETLKQPLQPLPNYVVFRNGVYDVLNNNLIPGSEIEVYNSEYYDFDFVEISDDDRDIKRMLEYFRKWLGCDIQSQLLIDWMSINTKQISSKFGAIVALIGEAGAGKSTYLDLLRKMTGNFSYSPINSNEMFNDSNRFAFASIEGKSTILLQEFAGRGKNTSLATLKTMVGKKGESIEQVIEKKGIDPYKIRVNAAITVDCESTFMIKPDDGGSDRRFIFIRLSEKNKKPELWAEYKDCFEGVEATNKIQKYVCWSIARSKESLEKSFETLRNHPIIANAKKTTITENDLFYEFVISGIEVLDPATTNPSSDWMLRDTLWDAYLRYQHERGLRESNQVWFMRNFKLAMKRYGLGDIEVERPRINGKKQRVVNIKFTEDFEWSSNSGHSY